MGYRLDLFAVFMLLGIVQAAFLGVFFFSKENRIRQSNVHYGWLLIAIAACLLEIFLMYTGYIQHLLHLVDFSETFALMLGPLFYLFIVTLARGPASKKVIAWNLAFPVLYFFLHIPFLIAPENVKYNSWITAYHPGLPYRELHLDYDPWMFFITRYHTWLVLISLGVYILLSATVIIEAFRNRSESFIRPQSQTLITLRNTVFQLVLFSVLIVVVKLLYKNDTGDHLFAAFGSLMIYATSFSVMSKSGFFKQAALTEQTKYKSSSLTAEQQEKLLANLRQVMADEKPFLNPSFSQPELANQLKVTVHLLSQAINDGLDKNFFELIAEYRVNEARKRLLEQPNIKVEEIAEQVGYNSKSSFNTAFKKITGLTPSEYRSHGGT